MASPRFSFFLLLALGALETATACDPTAFIQCLVPLNPYAISDGAGLLKYYTEAQMDTLCSVYEQVKTCAVPTMTGCAKTTSVIWETSQNSFDYLCSREGRSGYRMHAVCLSKTSITSGVTACNNALTNANNRLTSGSYSASEIKKITCSNTNEQVSCIYKVMSSECGQEPAQWLRTWLHKTLQPAADLIDCTLEAATATACDVTHFMQCQVSSLLEYEIVDYVTGFLNYYTEAQLDTFCSAYEQVYKCAVRTLTGCGTAVWALAWELTQKDNGYLCSSEGRSGYKKHAACLLKEGMTSGDEVCFSAFAHAHLRMSIGNYSVSEMLTIKCSSINEYCSCVYKVASSECGQEPAQWFRTWQYKILKQTSDLYKCTFETATETACDLTNFTQCLVPLKPYETSDGAGLLKYYTEAQLDTVCSVYEQVNTCAVPTLTGCGKTASAAWETKQNAYGYLCSSDGRSEYKKFGACTSKAGVTSGGTACNNVLISATKRLTSGVYSASEITKITCSNTNEYLSCVYKLVSSECGHEPAQWYRNWLHKSLKPHADLIDCTLGCAATKASLVLVALSSLMYYLLQ